MNHKDDSSTRKQILLLLKTKGPLSTSELTNQLHITNMAVRRHLQTLERDSLIEAKTVHQAMGRPAAKFKLTETGDAIFPKNYHSLTLDLLSELVLESGSDMVDTLFERRKQMLLRQHADGIQGKQLQNKVASLTGIQNDNGYMAVWERTSEEEEEYQLTEFNCPISQIANQYNQACRCELELFESLLDAEVNRTECLTTGDNRCVYKIRPREKDRPTS